MDGAIRKERYLYILAQLGITTALLFFFIKVCPLVVFDVDDWVTMGNFRLPIPIWKGAEAARVTPETLMPIVGWLAARVIHPICGDYAYSVTVVSAIILTLLIMAMCICLKKLLVRRCRLSQSAAVACEILFLSLFFLIFRNRGTSQCMFTAADLCCIYFYTISGILNAIVVLIFLRYNNVAEMLSSWNFAEKILFFLLIYFALFSNLFHSAITAIYAGIYLLINLRENKSDLGQYMRNNIICFFILITWGIALVFDANGGRADTVGMDAPLDFMLAFRQLITMLHALSIPFLLVLALSVAVIIFLIFRKYFDMRQEIIRLLAVIMCNEVLLTIFLLLLNSRLAYMSRIDASWGIWFYLIIFIAVTVAFAIKNIPLLFKMLPVLILAFVFAAVYPDGRFLMSTREHTDYQTCMELNHYVINSIVEADQKGMDEITIHIPNHSDDLRSLAYNDGLGNAVANCLYTHGIVSTKVEVQTIVDRR